MRILTKTVLPAALIGVVLSVYACGASTGVYVGVAVPGPYVGYPGVGYPGYVGRPPYVYEEDALNVPAGSADRVAASYSEAEVDRWCGDSDSGVECDGSGRTTSETTDERYSRSDDPGSLRD